jgi:hypothetical protein
LVGLKKLRPYRDLDDQGNQLPDEIIKKHKPNEHRVRKLKSEFKEELELKRRLVRENQITNL